MTHHSGRVERILHRVSAGLEGIGELTGAVKTEYVREHLGLARNRFNDVEVQFMQNLDQMSLAADAEAEWLDQAELLLAIAEQDLALIKGLVAKYGPRLESLP